jgi:hypothetical protein
MKEPTEKQLAYYQSMRGKTGKDGRHWKEVVGKSGAHNWLDNTFGRPKKCEKCGTEDNKRTYDWASKDHKYQKNREDYLRLCRSCHRKYDLENGLTRKRDRDNLGKFIN